MSARTPADRAEVVLAVATAFREHGYEGTSLSRITARTGLGKGSLYHFFPGGKEDMARAVLEQVDTWFEEQVFRPLQAGGRLDLMFDAVANYFASRHLVCLFATFALGQERESFAARIRDHFTRWIAAVEVALPATADRRQRAMDTVAGIQGALILARAMDDPDVFLNALGRVRARIATSGER